MIDILLNICHGSELKLIWHSPKQNSDSIPPNVIWKAFFQLSLELWYFGGFCTKLLIEWIFKGILYSGYFYSCRKDGIAGLGLKIPRGQLRAGSSPATSICWKVGETLILQRFSHFYLWWKMYVLVCTPSRVLNYTGSFRSVIQ